MTSSPEPATSRTEIVCVNVGPQFPDYYVQRLFHMLERNFHEPFRLTCFTDRLRDLCGEIRQIDVRERALEGPFNKLLLYDQEVMPYDAALFMDVTLMIVGDVTHLASYAQRVNADLVAVPDWRRPVMNSSVQWITKNETLCEVWKAYDQGKHPEFCTKGDQYFTYSALCKMGLKDRIGYFPEGEIQSFKVLREAHRRSIGQFEDLWEVARIVKFHGTPRPHEVLDPWTRFYKVTLRYPQYAAHDWKFLLREIREHWR
ncbi:MAG TPA: hypothetical protein VNI20_14210 [Fimbriimonadaceae bacterium]|nr:hypothetical protein [Fimbriimonadaceae bacterium]